MMNFFKNRARKSALADAKKKAKRKMGLQQLNHIKEAAIVMTYKLDIQNSAVNKLLDIFKKHGIQVSMLVYYPEKKLPANIVQHQQQGTVFFAKGDENWFGAPKLSIVQEFINKDFGLLIDLTAEHIFSLQYIIQASKAAFKVGRQSYPNDPYDFVVSGDEQDDNRYIDDLFLYLGKIKSS